MKKIVPKCIDNGMAHFTNEGRWVPCCNFNPFNFKERRDLIFLEDEYLLDNNTDSECFHKKKSFVDWVSSIQSDYEIAPNICKMTCSKSDSPSKSLNQYNQEIEVINNNFDLFCFQDDHDDDT